MKSAKFIAQKTLLEYGIKAFPIEPQTLKEIIKKEAYNVLRIEQNIDILKPLLGDKLTEFLQKPAFTICSSDIKAVFYSSKLTSEEMLEALSHELAHIRCGHISDGIVLGYCDDCIAAGRQEKEAQSFMREFLAPECIMRKLNITTSEDIERFFLLSKVNAAKQYAEFNKPGIRETPTEKSLLKSLENKQKRICQITLISLSVSMIFIAPLFSSNPATVSSTENLLIQTPLQISTPIHENEYLITPSGEKYHLPNCRYVKNKTNVINITKSDAEHQRKTPCSVCIN